MSHLLCLCQPRQPVQQQFPPFQAGRSWFLCVEMIPTLTWSFLISLVSEVAEGTRAACSLCSLTCALPSFPIPEALSEVELLGSSECTEISASACRTIRGGCISSMQSGFFSFFLSSNITQQCQNEISGSALMEPLGLPGEDTEEEMHKVVPSRIAAVGLHFLRHGF